MTDPKVAAAAVEANTDNPKKETRKERRERRRKEASNRPMTEDEKATIILENKKTPKSERKKGWSWDVPATSL